MTRINIITSILISSTVLTGGIMVNAEETIDNNGAQSNATISFEENKEATDPVIPPTNPTDPTDPNGPDLPTGNKEPLRIDIAPNFHFGQFTVGTGNKTANNTRVNSNIQVTDGRGTLEGWTVLVARTEFKNKEHVLPSELVLSPGLVKDGKNNYIELTGNIKTPVMVNSSTQPIFSATKNEGGGTYFQNFDDSRATLKFNSDIAKAGIYTAELTWTLTSGLNEGAR